MKPRTTSVCADNPESILQSFERELLPPRLKFRLVYPLILSLILRCISQGRYQGAFFLLECSCNEFRKYRLLLL